MTTCYPTGGYQYWTEGTGEVRVFRDSDGNMLTVWFGDPQQAHLCEETADEAVLRKDAGTVIGSRT